MQAPDELVGPINIGNPAEFSIPELARVIVDLTGSRSRIIHRALPQDDPRQRQPDIIWKPTTSPKDGQLMTYDPRRCDKRQARIERRGGSVIGIRMSFRSANEFNSRHADR